MDTRAPESRGGGAPSRAEGLLLPLVPFLLYAGANLPLLWKRDFFLYHDTFELFQLFYIGYRNVLLHGALPEWVPYGNYGMPSYVKDITGFSPFSYLTFAVGRTLGVSDAWPLFLVSLAAEVLVFAVGLHALCRVFLSRFASLLAGTAFLLTSPLWWNYGFHFRVIYLVPVASWLLVAFFRTGSASALALSGALLVLSSYGQPAYMLVMYAIYGVTLGGALAVAYRRRLHLQFDAASVVAVPLAVFFTGATAYLFVTSMRGVAFVARDRDPTTLQVPLSTFLRYGGGGVGKLVEVFIGVPVLTPDVFVHVTVVALVLAVYALVRERTRDFLAVAAAFVVLLVFCFGPYSPVAYALYFLPGMAYFRHVGLMYAFPRLLLVVLAGFGADRLLARLAEAPAVAGAARREVALLAVVGGTAGALAMSILGYRHDTMVPVLMVGSCIATFVALALVVLRAPVSWQRPLLAMLLLGQAGVYMGGFASAAYWHASMVDDIGVVEGNAFEERREVHLGRNPRSRLLDVVARPGVVYTEVSQFLEIDTCFPLGRVDMFVPGVVDLARMRFGADVNMRALPRLWTESRDDPFFRVLACEAAKLQLVTRFTEHVLAPGESPEGALGVGPILVETPGGEERRLILPEGGRRPAALNLRGQGLTVTGHSDNHLSVRLDAPGAAWLVYADGYHASWRADVDGTPAAIWRADHAIKAVRVPPGRHTVTFRFGDPTRHRVVWAVGLGGALLILAVIVAIAGRVPRPV